MDAKICDCCGKVIEDLHRARMKCFYIQDEPIRDDTTGNMRWWEVRKESPTIKVDICGKCFDKLRGFAVIGSGNIYYSVECKSPMSKCFVKPTTTFFKTKEEAIEAWNRRVDNG